MRFLIWLFILKDSDIKYAEMHYLLPKIKVKNGKSSSFREKNSYGYRLIIDIF
jgi:hypothetical protein